ncbi:ABC transporter substrate-binding protein [Gordoniibacillus kamchatkensis]|uniref:ABC transporter substrate-binding protein n=1 Tax=Gordoniibacillus kamchatkensis TaxID=1590651 RepID=UPI0018CEF837|nr:peptide ABC transporter substrate-binding protein [Paenibacillus sp. VKM B-2647]
MANTTVTMAVISTWNTLNIYNTSGNYGNVVADQLFERLVYREHDGKIAPRLAKSWKMAADYKSMTFQLAGNVKWHDGQPLTAKDIVFTVKAMTNPAVDNYYRSAFNVLAGTDQNGVAQNPDSLGVEAVSDTEVKFTFKEPKAEDTILSAFLSFLYVLPEHILGKGDVSSINKSDFWKAPVGAGPFKFVNQVPGESLQLEAFTDYYQGSPSFKTLVVRVVPATNLTAGLINGDIDVVAMGSIPLSDWETVKSNSSIVAASVPDFSYQYMLFNFSNKTFQDAKVRTAFDMAINKKLIVDKLMKGEGTVAVGPMPSYHPYYNAKLKPNEYKPDEAKKMLAEAGFDFNKEYLMIVPQGNQVREQSALLIQQDLAAIGVKIKIQTYDFATLLSMLKNGKSDLGLLGGGSNIDPGESSVIMKPGDPRNYSLLKDSKWYDIAARGYSLYSFNERKAVYDEYQQALVQDQPYIWLYHQNNLWAHSARLTNVPMEDFVWMNFATWKWRLAK